MTAGTISYYEEMVQLALEAEEDELRARSIVDQAQVLTLRHRFPTDELRTLDGAAVFAQGVDEGLIGDIGQLGIGEIQVRGDEAEADALSGGERLSFVRWRFEREDGRWKLDLTALFPLTKAALEQAASEAGLTTEELLVRTLEQASGEPVSPDIWDPPGR